MRCWTIPAAHRNHTQSARLPCLPYDISKKHLSSHAPSISSKVQRRPPDDSHIPFALSYVRAPEHPPLILSDAPQILSVVVRPAYGENHPSCLHDLVLTPTNTASVNCWPLGNRRLPPNSSSAMRPKLDEPAHRTVVNGQNRWADKRTSQGFILVEWHGSRITRQE